MVNARGEEEEERKRRAGENEIGEWYIYKEKAALCSRGKEEKKKP